MVQVNGADFFRKRKAPPQPAQPTPNKLRPQAAAAEIAAAMDEGSGIAAAATATAQAVPELAAAALGAVAGAHEMMQGQQQWEAQDEVMHEGDCMDAVLLSHGQYGPGEAYAEASLESIQDQLDRCLPPSCPKVIAVQFALEKLMQHGATQLDRSHGTGIYSQAARQVLNGFTDLLQQQADAARAMLLQVRPPRCFAQSSGSWQGAQAGQATPCASPAPGSKPAVEGTESAPLEQYLKQAPMVRELCSGSVLKAQLQQQLAVLKEEEQAWMNLRRKYAGEEEQAGGQSGPATTGPAAAEAAVDKGSSQAQGAAEAGACEGAVTAEQQAVQEGSGSLKRTEESVNAALKLRVRVKEGRLMTVCLWLCV